MKVMDRLHFIHAVCQKIPDAKVHQIRYYGAYASRKRRALGEARAAREGKGLAQGEDANSPDDLETPSPHVASPSTPGSAEARRHRPSRGGKRSGLSGVTRFRRPSPEHRGSRHPNRYSTSSSCTA